MRLVATTLFAALVATLAFAGPLNDLSIFNYQPRADPTAIVVNGNARFTILSDSLVRMEYSNSANFEDRATFAIVNRKTLVPQFTQSTSDGWLTITTSKVTVRYQTGQAFGAGTLKAQTNDGKYTWYYTQYDTMNLMGTIKSLDEICNPTLNCSQQTNTLIHDEHLHCQWGVISQNGWAVFDDTNNYILSSTSGAWFSNADRAISDVDVYWFGHGMNYKGAVYDLAQVAGRQQLTARHLLGSWYTRWFDFDNDDVAQILEWYKKTDLPLDVLILDMNWHTKDSWTGYSWDKTLFPKPQDTVDYVHNKGLKIGANLHDAVGFGFWEDQYATMAKTLNIDPTSQLTVPFSPLNRSYMLTMEDQVLAKLGFDVWWIDWQQGGNVGGMQGERMNPTFVTDHVRSTDHIRRGENVRDNILARWGGMGTQRYPVGFSGDVSQLSWQCLQYQPYFVATAANVGYGTISNDLEGPSDDHEMHVRWMQFGAYSPVMRIHDRGMSSGACSSFDTCSIVDLWKLPYNYLEPIRAAMKERAALIPYTYTMTRNTFDLGLAMIRPMYYEFPSINSAYSMTGQSSYTQYMFGDDMFVAPIVAQSQHESGLQHVAVWIPPGAWYDDVFGDVIQGGAATSQGTTINRQYGLDDVPRFFRAGAVVPRIRHPSQIGSAGRAYSSVDWTIYPGALLGTGKMYEDDGETHDYVSGSYAWTTVSFLASGTSATITIGASQGSFNGQLTSRNTRILLEGVLPLSGATLNGAAIPSVRFPEEGQLSYTYDGAHARVVIDLGSLSTTSQTTVTVTFVQQDTVPSMTSRAKVYAKRASLAKAMTDQYQATPFETLPGPGSMKQAAANAGHISYMASANPAGVSGLLANYLTLLDAALAELGGYPGPTPLPTVQDQYLLQMFSNERSDMLLCGSDECIATNPDYEVMWVDGFMPSAAASNAAVFYDYFNQDNGDNWATWSSTPPATGYSPAVFPNGQVYNAQGSGLACLNVYYSATWADHMTTAHPLGIQWAQDNGYVQVGSCVGWVATSESSSTTKQKKSPKKRLQEARDYVATVRKRHALKKLHDGAEPPAKTPKHPKKQAKVPLHGKKIKSDNVISPVDIAIAFIQSATGG